MGMFAQNKSGYFVVYYLFTSFRFWKGWGDYFRKKPKKLV
jgi:hypothetical protein